MAASKLNINFSGVSLCGVSLTNIKSLQIRQGASFQKWKADASIYPTAAVLVDNDPGFTVTTGDIGTAESMKGLTTGSTTVTVNDAKAATGGACTWTLANPFIADVSTSANHGDFAMATIKVDAISTDGTTNPMSFSRA